MKITDVRTAKLVGPDSHGVGGKARNVSFVLVRVDTDEGLYGIGEAEAFMGVREAIAHIRDRLIGKDPLSIRAAVTEVLYGGKPPHEPSMAPTATQVPAAWGMSGVEMALCDLAGKALGTPTYNLFGGRYRDAVRIYLDRSSPPAVDDLGQWRALAADAKERGFDFIKFDVDYTAPDFTEDVWNRVVPLPQLNRIVERVSAVREEVGGEMEIALDCHWHYDVVAAVRLANELAPLKPIWLEDPTPITNPDAVAEVRAKSPIPICVGEMFTAEQSRLFIDRRACDIIHPDVLFTGGLHETRKIADYADLNYIPMAMHNNGGAVATMAAAHVAAASPNFIGLEYHFSGAPWVEKLVARGRPLFENGHLNLTGRPGLGFELDPDVCRKYLAEGEQLF